MVQETRMSSELMNTVANELQNADQIVAQVSARHAGGGIDDQCLMARVQKCVAPSSPTEQAVFDIWAEVLECRDFGVEDDFLELGGDSLQATRVLSRIRDAFDIDLPVATVFADSLTVSSLAQMIDRVRIEEP